MSREPKRMIDGVLTEDELRALSAGRRMAPPPGTGEAVLAGVLAKVGPSGSGGEPGLGGGESVGAGAGGVGVSGAGSVGLTSAAGATATGMSAAALLKAFGVGSGLTVAALVGHELVHEPPAVHEPAVESAKVTDPVPVDSASPPLRMAEPVATAEPVFPIDANVKGKPSKGVEPEEAVYGARWESAWVARGRAELRAGRPSDALRTLAEIQGRVSGGVLGQEREALTIEALAASGQRSAASQRAIAFVERFPNSPHASRVREFVSP